MEYSSEKKASEFAGLRLEQTQTLLSLLQESTITDREYIHRRFLERSSEFEATLAFLVEIGAVNIQGNNLLLSEFLAESLDIRNQYDTRRAILDMLFTHKNNYCAEAFEYLRRFEVNNGIATHQPSDSQRSAESAVRNFLMDLDIVTYDKASSSYHIAPEYSNIFSNAKLDSFHSLSVTSFERMRRAEEEIGAAAELLIIEYERKRLGPELASQVDYVAIRDVSAGYDIRSVTKSTGNIILPRYIEVKAVPSRTYQFYWSQNERNVAQIFGSWYFLYLLPVCKGGIFQLEELRIIENPCTAIFESQDEWIIESNVLRCSVDTSYSG